MVISIAARYLSQVQQVAWHTTARRCGGTEMIAGRIDLVLVGNGADEIASRRYTRTTCRPSRSLPQEYAERYRPTVASSKEGYPAARRRSDCIWLMWRSSTSQDSERSSQSRRDGAALIAPPNNGGDMQAIINNLRAMQPEMHQMAESLAHYDNIGYFRVVDRKECVDAANKEAHEHGSILAFKGDVTVIMPKLIPGWTEYGGAL